MDVIRIPSLVPIMPDNPAIPDNKQAWKVFERWEKPFITAFADDDPVTKGREQRWIDTVPGAKGQAHAILKDAGHFLQDDVPDALSSVLIDFIRAN